MSEPTAPAPESPDARTHPLLPGYVFTTPPYLAHCDVEEELHRRYAARYIDLMARADPARDPRSVTDEAMGKAFTDRPFLALSDKYLEAVLSDTTLTPFLVAACLNRKHPEVTARHLSAKLTAEQMLELRPLVLGLMGFVMRVPTEQDTRVNEVAANGVADAQ